MHMLRIPTFEPLLPRLGVGFALLLLLAACGPEPAGPEPGGDDRGAAMEPGSASSGRAAVFAEVAGESGLDFVHDNGMSGRRWFVEMMGAGAGLFDYDGDGDLDLYLIQGGPLEGAAGQDAPAAGDRLYRNDLEAGGGWPSFVDVTEAAGLAGATGYGMGMATGDYDGDGDIDLYLANWGANQLWRNEGDGSFRDVTAEAGAGLDDPGWSVGASFVDYDRDGRLDLVIVNYDDYDLQRHVDCHSPRSGRLDYCGPQSYPPQPDRLLRNRGDGSFADVSAESGILAAYGPALGVVAADLDADGWQDLFVANDGAENQQWMNQAGQRFVDRAPAMGTALNRDGLAEASMGVLAEDFDADGDLDLFLTHLERESNTLYLNDGTGFFEDATRRSGLGPPSIPYTAFGVAALDYDNDGIQDLAITNGEVRIIDEQADAGDPLPLRQPKLLFRGLGDGRFEDVTAAEGGELFTRPEVGRGMAAGDIDNDGDTDLLLSHNGGPAWLLRNELGQDAAWIGLRLLDPSGRRDMLGARVGLLQGGRPVAWRRVATDGSYASARDPRAVFGLGDRSEVDGMVVHWPDGAVERFDAREAGRYHDLVQGAGRPEGSR